MESLKTTLKRKRTPTRKEVLETWKEISANLANNALEITKEVRNISIDEVCKKRKRSSSPDESLTKEPRVEKPYHKFRSLLMHPTFSEVLDPFQNDLWYSLKIPDNSERVLVVSMQKATLLIDKEGFLIKKLNTNLPSGNYKTKIDRGSYCILLAFYTVDTLYFYDILVWNSTYYSNCQFDFRLFWLNSKISELTDGHQDINFSILNWIPLNLMEFNNQNFRNYWFIKSDSVYVSGYSPDFLFI